MEEGRLRVSKDDIIRVCCWGEFAELDTMRCMFFNWNKSKKSGRCEKKKNKVAPNKRRLCALFIKDGG